LTTRHAQIATLFPYTTLFRSVVQEDMKTTYKIVIVHGPTRTADVVYLGTPSEKRRRHLPHATTTASEQQNAIIVEAIGRAQIKTDRKSTRLNSSHLGISYAVF